MGITANSKISKNKSTILAELKSRRRSSRDIKKIEKSKSGATITKRGSKEHLDDHLDIGHQRERGKQIKPLMSSKLRTSSKEKPSSPLDRRRSNWGTQMRESYMKARGAGRQGNGIIVDYSSPGKKRNRDGGRRPGKRSQSFDHNPYVKKIKNFNFFQNFFFVLKDYFFTPE